MVQDWVNGKCLSECINMSLSECLKGEMSQWISERTGWMNNKITEYGN